MCISIYKHVRRYASNAQEKPVNVYDDNDGLAESNKDYVAAM